MEQDLEQAIIDFLEDCGTARLLKGSETYARTCIAIVETHELQFKAQLKRAETILR